MAADGGAESKPGGTASLFNDAPLPEHERIVFDRLRHDESTQLDELIEQLEAELGSAEIFTALFELELGRSRETVARKKLCAGILSRIDGFDSRDKATQAQIDVSLCPRATWRVIHSVDQLTESSGRAMTFSDDFVTIEIMTR